MASLAATKVQEPAPASVAPLLEPGDRLSRAEFERRYGRMPHLMKAELIEGTVYVPSPAGDMKAVLATLRRGLESPEHRAFSPA